MVQARTVAGVVGLLGWLSAAACGGVTVQQPPQDPDCPAGVPMDADACPKLGLECTYTQGACSLTFTCSKSMNDPSDDFACRAEPLAWVAPDTSTHPGCEGCSEGGSCVLCHEASDGDPCDMIGFPCLDGNIEGGGNCSDILICGADHKWQEITEPGCCI